jgi:hypothetical protein
VVAPWWGENSKDAYSSGLANLATALTNWSDSTKGKRRGRKLGFPRFKGKRGGWSCRFTTGAFGLVGGDRRHVKLPRIGVVRTHESTRTLARHVDRGTARIRSATVSHRAGRWLGTPTNEAPGSFWTASVEEAAGKLAAILREEDADVLTCYDDFGTYGHPDHIQVHRVGMRRPSSPAPRRSSRPPRIGTTCSGG